MTVADDPRIPPLPEGDWTSEHRELMSMVAQGHNIFRTLVRHPAAFRAFLGWGNHVLSKANTLAPRLRELVILRTARLCGCRYVWAQHVAIGRRAGLSDQEIAAVAAGDGSGLVDEPTQAALAGCAELHRDHAFSDATWTALARHFTQQQCMDLLFTTTQYMQVSTIANGLRVERDSYLTATPDLWPD